MLANEINILKNKLVVFENKESISLVLEAENKLLHENVEKLNEDLANFVQGRDNLDKLLSQQTCDFNKVGLGYEENEQNKYYKYLFDKSNDKGKQKIQEKSQIHAKKKKNNITKIKYQACYNCRKKGYMFKVCPYFVN